jgi:hypothetical protein
VVPSARNLPGDRNRFDEQQSAAGLGLRLLERTAIKCANKY